MMQRPQYHNTPPFGERLVIIKDGAQRELLYPYSISGIGDIKIRAKEAAKGYNHGANVSGDGKVESRKIKLGLDIRGQSEEDHDSAINEIYGIFTAKNFLLATGRRDRIYNVASATEIKQKYHKGFKQRWSDVDITLLLADPFRSALQESEKEAVYEQPQEATDLQINNGGNIDTPLRIVLTPEVTMSDVIISHEQTGYTCRIRDSLLTNPAILTVDTKKGTVTRGNFNAINTQSGQFLIALPGVNTYKITCAAGKVAFYYTERWLV